MSPKDGCYGQQPGSPVVCDGRGWQGPDLVGPESGGKLLATQEQGFAFWEVNLGQNCPEGARADQGDCTFPARDGGLSGDGEQQVPLRMLRN